MLPDEVVVSAAVVSVRQVGASQRFNVEGAEGQILAEGVGAPSSLLLASSGASPGTSPGTSSVDRTRHTSASLRLSQIVRTVLRQADLNGKLSQATDFGIVSGSHYGCAKVYELHQRLRSHGPRGIDAVYFAQATHSYPLSVCAIEYGFKGPCAALVGFHSAGLKALLCARDWLRDGRCEHVIVAAYEDIGGPIRDHIQKIDLHGQVREAMAVLCLERRTTAIERGAPILAELQDIEFLRSDPSQPNEANLFLGASGIAELALVLTGEEPWPSEDVTRVSAIDPIVGGLSAGFRLTGWRGTSCAQ